MFLYLYIVLKADNVMDTSCVATITDYLTLTREAVIKFHEQRDAYIRNQIKNKLNKKESTSDSSEVDE